MKFFTFLLLICSISYLQAQVYKSNEPLVHTYSIVAKDSITGELAVGVQSHWFSVGTAVPWIEAGVGAVATQSFVDKSYGPNAIALLKKGLTAKQALDSLLKIDAAKDVRQVAIVDNYGNVAAHTGNKCIDFANHFVGNGFSVQSNMMLNEKIVSAMQQAFIKSVGKPLAERVLLVLEAAEFVGGDIRGKQSAAIVVADGSITESWNNKKVDLRVDDHAFPLKELRRLYTIHLAYEYMNKGDLAIEKNDMELAMKCYNNAMKLFPGNLEMQYWTAIALANNHEINKSALMLQKIYLKNPNWRKLTERLPKVGLLQVTNAEFKQLTQ
ncbi:MAG: DUF1028 domain-containing protein [Chitinophagaceae bacterium]